MQFRHVPTVAGMLLLASSVPASSQSVGRMLVDDFKHAGGDMWAVWTSPIRATGTDWLIAAGTFGVAALVSPLDDDIDRWAVGNADSRLFKVLGPVRKGGAAYGGNSLVPVAGAALIGGYIARDQGTRDGISGCVASYAANSQLRHQVIYRFINRRRPVPGKSGADTVPAARHGDQYDISISTQNTSWGDNSFPGGHVANIMACATFLNNRFEFGAGEPLLYAFTAAVGLGRIIDRGHWTSDQIVGVVFGYAIGREVALRQRRRIERGREAGAASVAELPRSSRDGFYLIRDESRGTGIGWQRRF